MPRKPKSPTLQYLENLTGGPLTLGELLRSIREGEGWTQTAFAEKLGISKSHICDLEKSRKSISPERAARFAALLGYPVTQFVRLALQQQVTQAGLELAVHVEAA